MHHDPQENAPGRPGRARAATFSSVRAPDYWRIDLTQAWQVRFWTRELGVSEEELRDALRAAGDHVGRVREYLLSQRKS
jgi:hypothetical protein